jgi:hypothetical protein
MRAPRRPWTDHEVARAKAMRAAGHSYTAIDIALDRYVGATQQKLTYGLKHVAARAERDHTTGGLRAPDCVLADRDARAAALDRRTPTQEFFGDPPPGYSALDRQRKSQNP